MEKSKDELVERAKKLKQRDKLKVFNIIIDSYLNGTDIESTITQALEWCDKLCD